jgi:hypothetical protein
MRRKRLYGGEKECPAAGHHVVENPSAVVWRPSLDASSEYAIRLQSVSRPVTTSRITVAYSKHDGRWHDGQLRAWRRDDDGCRANVCFSVAPGMRYLEWLPAERMRE